jgi:DNA (cytosine-5)-methyltransferase 1
MRYASVCSGVEAASLAWAPLGWKPVFFAEVEPFPCAVLQQRFNATKPLHPLDPAEATDEKDRKMRESWLKQINKLPDTGTIPNLGDFTKIKGEDYVGAIDLLVGGTPCQDLSVAGKRAGFEGARSSLALDFVRLAYEARCQYFVWENVPGVFSSNRGRDFATLLSMFCGYTVDVPKDGWKSSGIVQNRRPDRYGLAWRVLDARFTRVPGFPFAVPQRRRRVFLVGCFGDWTRAAEILIEPERVRWDTPSRGKEKQKTAVVSGNRADETEKSSHWDGTGTHPTLGAIDRGIGASDQELFSQRGANLVGTFWNGGGCSDGTDLHQQ